MSFVEGFAEDDCGDACVVESHDVFGLSYASACDEITVRIAFHDALIELESWSGKRSVSANLRTEHVLRACRHVASKEILKHDV